jgi:putative heme-binding domain-containing protein
VRFHHFTGLEDHGYPRMYMNFADEIVKPLADYGGGSGCGSAYLSEPGIPAKWNDAPLTCDWGTNALWHHKVEPHGATFKETAKPEPLIQMTRPTDADVDGMSRIYQASWKGATFAWEGPEVGYIVSVSPKGYTPEPLPDFNKATVSELVRLLESPSQVRTLEAQRALLRRPGSPAMKQALLALAGNSAKPLPARVAALYALTQRGVKRDAAAPIIKAVAPLAADPLLQRFVLRALADAGLDRFSEVESTAPFDLYAAGMKSGDPRTRLEAIVGATRQNMVGLGPNIAALLGDQDPIVAHTAFRSLPMLNAADACFNLLDTPAVSPAQRTGALRALMRMHLPEVVHGLTARLEKATQPAARGELLAALCRLYFQEGEWNGDSWGTRPDTRGPYYQPVAWSATPAIAAVLKAELARSTPENAAAFMLEMKRNRIEFQEALQRIIALTKENPGMLPDLVTQLAGVENIPADGIPYLISAARGDWPTRTLAQAVETLAKTDSAEGCLASLAAIDKLANTKDADKHRDSARNALLGAPKLENHHHLLEVEAAKLNGGVSQWADAALLALSARKNGSPESRELSRKAIDAGWKDAKRRVQMMKAIQSIGSHELDDQVRAAEEDADPKVAEVAKETAKSLKLEKKGEDKTPLVSSLKPEEVVAEVVKTKGSVGSGQQVYMRLGCVTCHAATLEEAQKGPFLGNIAQTYNRADLAENILDPQKTIAQGFATELFTLKDGSAQMGFVTLESADEVKVRNITGQEFSWKTGEIAKRDKLPNSMMPPGLVSGSTIREFASLLDYLESLSKK